MKKASEYLLDTSRPGGARSSVRNGNCTRFVKAEEQAKLKIIEIPKIIDYTNEFLGLLGIDLVSTPKRERKFLRNNLYKEIKEAYNLEDARDIVWMKFTKDGFLGVVATSNDINFDIPLSEKEYDKKHNTSGIIIHYLGKKWDESFVLIFPLLKIPEKLERGDVERGIGNYLINKGVPILDFFSHRY